MGAEIRESAEEAEVARYRQPSDLESEVSRTFRAPIDRVFRVFTDATYQPYLWSPQPERVTVEAYEFRPGGRFSIVVRQADGSTGRFVGEFLEIDPPRRVVCKWYHSSHRDTGPVETQTFERVGDFTRVTARWRLPDRAARDRMAGPGFEAVINAQYLNIDRLLATA